ncbi:hypothetical protein SERLA73DRAFT_72673 [Serpula lacrymans var. lacrymans S7.3]|uniref:Amidohydrolase-related domain-containing protein n=2 Tax=Serpula lacrymans var. lacrymans TaxID=341189 RepID=F8PW38_SERL3|nr:uncharacterized protein SERLADRAFT_437205 [Serpula lacrymans var. lacrymans S7.9]EGN99897.1 hypothetical protein SERLA73DRAFT_72673 [Serpula lacrymans var. lacrymans S7.3]EGO25465.1 hypothetical protein SERLADRAFT_437205 [Serpula lacrymans var. lacrymans S7.9]
MALHELYLRNKAIKVPTVYERLGAIERYVDSHLSTSTSPEQQLSSLNVKPGPPSDFHSRAESDRFVPGTKPTLLRNASIWTGRRSGLEVIHGDLLLDKGLIQFVGQARDVLGKYEGLDLTTVDLSGAWVTPGIIDIHSHIGAHSSPLLDGAYDINSYKGLVQPWLRILDGLNTHDDSYKLSISGGVTTSVILPGSVNSIGGQAFAIKLRPTEANTPGSMLLEPPYSINGSHVDPLSPPRWRQMKHACGENPSHAYSGTRMDTIWAFREGYEHARKIKEAQDEYCSKAFSGGWDGLGDFPEDLQWEALVDVLRGRVKVHAHCYEAVDLDALVRLTNEFQFPIAAFHHAHEAYLVPDLLKQAYGHPPAIVLFATEARYKREAYRGSEYAPRILAENGIDVIMKSDHPVLNSRFLLYEAQQAHYYGLPQNLALASVTSTPARIMGQDHRIGFIQQGYDADIVVWDSHPLSLGATPKQVYADGIPQIESPYTAIKPASLQNAPVAPNFDTEAFDTLKHTGLPPLEAKKAKPGETVVFTNISNIFVKAGSIIQQVYSPSKNIVPAIAIVKNGKVVCQGSETVCSKDLPSLRSKARWVDLEGGSISPGLVSFGSPLGLQEMQGELSTVDGSVIDPLSNVIPKLLEGGEVIHASDGLQYAARDALLAYRSGVTSGISAPKSTGFLSGFSTVFATGAANKLEKGALIQRNAALHVAISHSNSGPSISTQIATLRRLLLGTTNINEFSDAAEGKIPLVVKVESADVIASLIELKAEVEEQMGNKLQLTLVGASEAHLLAREIGEANVGVILIPSRPFPFTWESQRILPGPPITKDSAISLLLAHHVTVGIGIKEQWSARNTRFDAAWAALEADGQISEIQALSLASTNLETLLGVRSDLTDGDLVITRSGGLLDMQGKVIATISARRGVVDFI